MISKNKKLMSEADRLTEALRKFRTNFLTQADEDELEVIYGEIMLRTQRFLNVVSAIDTKEILEG